jgi:hypothetical protein
MVLVVRDFSAWTSDETTRLFADVVRFAVLLLIFAG